MKVPYFVAKYIEDPIRMEAKNIGVVALIDNRLYSRFLGEEEGGMDLRKVRGQVRQTAAYKQWIEYWHYVMATEPTPELALKQLANSSRQNYLITEAATLAVDDDEGLSREWVMEYLFNLLVSSFPEPKSEELSLAQRCDEIIGEYHLGHNPRFTPAPPVLCEIVPGINEFIQPSYGYVNGREIYFQRVAVSANRPEYSSKEVHNAAWIFERLRSNNRDRETKALVKMASVAEIPSLLKVLEAVSTNIVDVDNPEQVQRTFAAIAG